MTNKRIENLKKEIKDALNHYLEHFDDGVSMAGGLFMAAEKAVRLQVYLELENKKS